VVECAQACGLDLLKEEEKDGIHTTSYGVGEMVLYAVKHGSKRIMITLGGSATNDGGIGMLSALGIRFLDIDNQEVVPVGDSLDRVVDIDITRAKINLDEVDIIGVCDVTNPLLGYKGASYVFGPQKGVKNVEEMDRKMKFYADVTTVILGRDERRTPGTGAAGGLGFAIIAYLGGRLSPGLTEVAKMTRLEEAIKDRVAKTGKKPKAIVPVALYGMPYRIDRIMEIANHYDIPVIEDAAEGFGSKFNGQVLGTFGKYGVLSFNGNKMITTSGGGALITENEEEWREIMMYATQYRESYPYYQHEKIGFNYRMSNICAGIGRGQMTVVNDHIAHHKHVQALYEELLKDVPGVRVHSQPAEGGYDSNYWLCTITIDENVKVKGQENAYKQIVTGAVGGAAGVIHSAESATTDCQPNANVEALRVGLDAMNVEARPVWKPMHKQPVYKNAPAYVNGVSEAIFKVGMCLPAGPYVNDDDVRYIVDIIKELIVE